MDAQWWTMRRAHSLRPATYRCPLCGRELHAMFALPEGALAHAFGQFQCLVESGSAVMPTLDEWRATRREDRA